jgi:hypothetical protein
MVTSALSGRSHEIFINRKMIVHLVDGTYELFRHFYGLRRFNKGKDRPYGAVVGVLQTVLQMIDPVKGSASRGPIPQEIPHAVRETRISASPPTT